MVVRVGQFEKISIEQWNKDCKDDANTYNQIPLPARSSVGSAGYDIHSTKQVVLKPGEDVLIPTGLKCKMEEGWVLMAFPRSGLGFKYYVRLANTVGVIDASYYNNESNEGHIFVKLRNEGQKDIEINMFDRICQMIFMPYGITYDDMTDGVRKGGFGSSGK